MDPITRAHQTFVREAKALFGAGKKNIVRFVTEHEHRGDMMKSLRIWEVERDNRRPFFLYEEPFRSVDTYFDGLSKQLIEDYGRIRDGAAKEGVQLPAFTLQDAARVATLEPLGRSVVHVERIAVLLGERLEGILIALLPKQIHDSATWQRCMEAWVKVPWSARVRIGLFDVPHGVLENIAGEVGARFVVDRDELFAYLKQMVTNESAGPPLAPKPVPTDAQKREHEERTGQSLMPAEEGRRLRLLLVEAAEFLGQARHGEAAQAYGRARGICQLYRLRLEEAAVLFALAGMSLALGSAEKAIDCYRQAAEIGREEKQLHIVAQAYMGMAGVYMMVKDWHAAAKTYAMAADAAKKAEVPALRIEALRLVGTCHVMRGAREEAIPVWQDALREGTALDPATRKATTLAEVVNELAAFYERQGMRAQAAHVRSLVEEPKK